jgi:hypothetical protein
VPALYGKWGLRINNGGPCAAKNQVGSTDGHIYKSNMMG